MNASATKVSFRSRAFDAATRYAFDMEVTNWERLDGEPEKITASKSDVSEPGELPKAQPGNSAEGSQGAMPRPGSETSDEFRRQHSAQARLSLEEFDRYLVVEPDGDGWIAVPRTLVRREQREARRK